MRALLKAICYTIVISLISTTAIYAQSQTLCLKNRLKVNKKGKIKNKASLVVAEAGQECPKGTSAVLNTDSFKGADGAVGAPGVDGTDGANGAIGEDGAGGANGLNGGNEVTIISANGNFSDDLDGVLSETWSGGAFTKLRADTDLKITFHGLTLLRNDAGALGATGVLQVRVDGTDTLGNSDSTYNTTATGSAPIAISSLAANATHYSNVSTTALFTGVAAGAHTASLWTRATNTPAAFTLNPSSSGPLLMVVEEILPIE